MSINSISGGIPSVSGSSLGAKEDLKIKELEQKLSQLNKEKDKAKKAKDLDKVRELEQKIQRVKQQLEELQNRKAKKKTAEEDVPSKASSPQNDLGNYVDEFA